VVGVAADVKHFGVEEGPRPEVFLCAYFPPPIMALAVRTQGEPESLISAVRLKLRELDPNIPPFELRSMEEVMEKAGASRRFLTSVVTGFAGLALLLAAIGIYSQLAYSVTQRTPEIGIRIALGARQGQVIGMILRQGLLLAGTGLAIGFATALMVARWTQKLLFGVTPMDAVTFATAPILLLAVSVLACLIPAWRAARADPARTLRHD
jgi:ABC-type antimicrobial peptide transport system permease subunit